MCIFPVLWLLEGITLFCVIGSIVLGATDFTYNIFLQVRTLLLLLLVLEVVVVVVVVDVFCFKSCSLKVVFHYVAPDSGCNLIRSQFIMDLHHISRNIMVSRGFFEKMTQYTLQHIAWHYEGA